MTPLNDPLVIAMLETNIPTVILKADAPNFTITHYNKAYEDATYIKKRNVRGLSLWEAFDYEKSGSHGPTTLLESFHEAIYTNKIVQMKPLQYNILSEAHNIWEPSWWNIKIVPIACNGIVKYLLLNSHNITDELLHQDAIEQAIMNELTMVENLATTNVKLNLTINKLTNSHNELTKTQSELEEHNKYLQRRVFERSVKLFASDAKNRVLIDNAPVAIAVLKGRDHIIETANKKIIEYWGKTEAVINKPLALAIPELEGQPFIELLNDVRKTGVPYINRELCAFITLNSVLQPRYFDMIYQPIEHMEGADSIFIIAVDITDHVKARKSLEQSEAMLQIAVTAANIGTWSFNPDGRVMDYNPVFAKILGWESHEMMTHTQALGQVPKTYHEAMAKAIMQGSDDGVEYNFTYMHKRFNDDQVITVRLTGKATLDHSGNHKIFSGIIREVTDDSGDGHQL